LADLLDKFLILSKKNSMMNTINHENFKLSSLKHNPTKKEIKIKNAVFGPNEIQLIMGPCAIESEKQLEEIANEVKNFGIKIFRACAYKPRTHPYSFQGMGEKGIQILSKIGEKYDLITETEVTDTRQVKMVSEKIDILRIGARNMQNFELLKEVGKINNPVILKNGLSSTIEEHLNAAEHILSKGNPNVILCTRGIRGFEPLERFTYDALSIPILKTLTNLPIIADPSHPTGNKELVLPLARAQIASGADGLLVEVHNNPYQALTDSKQQLNTNELPNFIEEIKKVAQATNRKIDLTKK
jgi:3-deoxy-7-phosphoheptulonate synthase